MKRIKIETADSTLWAKPLTLGQLEEHETDINQILADCQEYATSKTNTIYPLDLLRRQGEIVVVALKNHDNKTEDNIINGLSIPEITEAFNRVLSGTGLEKVPEGEPTAVA